jgi:c-di-GMP-binding flagellar brake protein YcgR
MVEKRKSHRFRLVVHCTLSGHEVNYQGQLENISLNGALVRFEQGSNEFLSGEYDFTLYLEDTDLHLRIIVEVVCVTNGLTGLKFVTCDSDTNFHLGQLLRKLAAEQDKPGTEKENIRKHLTDYLRPS